MHHILAIFLLSLFIANAHTCDPASLCDDQNSCSGTAAFPDVCVDGECVPGADTCPVYSKQTIIGLHESTGELQVTNDDTWVYILWQSSSTFRVSRAYLFASVDPLASDDPETFPFQLNELADGTAIQMRVSLDYLHNPTEMDPVYLSLRFLLEFY